MELNCDFEKTMEKISEMLQDPQNLSGSEYSDEELKLIMKESEREHNE